jgi:hypothetical protein
MVRQQQQIKQKTANYELLEDILQSIKLSVDDQKYNFQQYVKAAQNEGLTQAEVWSLAKEILASHVSMKTLYNWGHEFLSEEAFNPIKQHAANLSHKRYSSAVNLQQAIQEQIEYEDENVIEAYELEKVKEGKYSYAFLQRIVVYLDETIELNCRGK